MVRLFVLMAILTVPCVVKSECDCVHCRFEYLGSDIGYGYSADSFMNASVVSEIEDRYCDEDYMLSYRKINWLLYQIESAARMGDLSVLSNAVRGVSLMLRDDCHRADANACAKVFPYSLKLRWLEKIEYCMARMVLSDVRDRVLPYIEELLPSSLLVAKKGDRFVHSLGTFKQMLLLGSEIEKYREREQCYPINLASVCIPEKMRKCAYGRDVEYEYYRGRWMLRCRCDSWEGGLRFDEYLPFIHSQRKHLDLCFSSTFNEKRKTLYGGSSFFSHDDRLSCCITHDKKKSGVHKVKFSNESAGNFRIVPKSERSTQ